jgi:hypothetical protein
LAGATEEAVQAARSELQVKAVLKRVTGYATEALGKAFSVAVVTAGADFRAARYRIPRCVSPFDWRRICHGHDKNKTGT